MKRVKILVASVLFCAMGYVGYTAHQKMAMSEAEKFMKANIEALTDEETGGGSGLLWKKEWWGCTTGDYIEITSTSGGYTAGATYKYTASLAAQLRENRVSFRIVPGNQPGQKSYCKDGWNFCTENDCR